MSDPRPATQTSSLRQTSRLPIAFWGLLALAAAIRLPGIERPLLGNFSTKSVMYGMIARNWVEGRAGILYPTLDCIVGGQRSLHMLEFSVSAYLTGAFWWLFGGSLDVWGRSLSVAFSVASVLVLFLLVRRWHGATAAFGAGFVVALSPISIVYGQNFMLDASIVFFTVATFYTLDRWLSGGWSVWLAAAALFFALLLLTKIYLVVLLLPLGAMVVFRNRWAAPPSAPERSTRTTLALAGVAALLAVLPVFVWAVHALRVSAPDSPHASYVYSCLQGNAESYRPPDPLLRNPDFYRQLLDDLTGVILTPLGFVLLLAGFLDRGWRRHAAWLVAMIVLVLALPRKFYDMNYYYMAVLLPLAVVAGLGWQVVSERIRPGRAATAALLVVAIILSMRYAARPAFVTPEEDRAVVAAGRAIQGLAAPEEPVVTMHGEAIDLVYYCDRPGWALPPDTPDLAARLDECAAQGARYLVIVAPEETIAGLPQLPPPIHRAAGYSIHPLDPPQ